MVFYRWLPYAFGCSTTHPHIFNILICIRHFSSRHSLFCRFFPAISINSMLSDDLHRTFACLSNEILLISNFSTTNFFLFGLERMEEVTRSVANETLNYFTEDEIMISLLFFAIWALRSREITSKMYVNGGRRQSGSKCTEKILHINPFAFSVL